MRHFGHKEIGNHCSLSQSMKSFLTKPKRGTDDDTYVSNNGSLSTYGLFHLLKWENVDFV